MGSQTAKPNIKYYQLAAVSAVTYLINFFFGMCQKRWKMWKSFTIQNYLCLFISTSDNVSYSSQRSSLQQNTFFKEVYLVKTFLVAHIISNSKFKKAKGFTQVFFKLQHEYEKKPITFSSIKFWATLS